MSGYFARLAQRSGVGAAAPPAPNAAATAIMPLEQSVEIVVPPVERPVAATLVADARTAAPRRAETAGAPRLEQSESAPRPLALGPTAPAARLPAASAPAPEAWLALATAAQDAPASRLADDRPKAAARPAPASAEQAALAAGVRLVEAPMATPSRPPGATPPAARHLFTTAGEAIDPPPAAVAGVGPAVMAASGPVEVRIGTITLRVQPPPAPPPARPAAPQRADRFSPHRHYLRGW